MSEPDDTKPKDAPAEQFQPNSPVTLKEAAEILLRGLVTQRTLTMAISKGELRGYPQPSCSVLLGLDREWVVIATW